MKNELNNLCRSGAAQRNLTILIQAYLSGLARARHASPLQCLTDNNNLIAILNDPSSLTKRFKSLAKQSFAIEVVKEGWTYANKEVYQLLEALSHEYLWVRQIKIKVDGEIFLHAKTFIPQKTLTGPGRQLLFLKTKPLGELLFQDTTLKRSDFQWSKPKNSDYGHNCITRTSIFYYHELPLLVEETFTDRALAAFSS